MTLIFFSGNQVSMAQKIASKNKNHPGVFYTESARQKHNGRPDRIFWITFHDNGKKEWIRIGRASEGITEEYAFQRRIDILNKLNLGENPALLAKKKAPSLDAVATAYFEWMKAEGKSAGREQNRYDLHIKPVLGATTLAAITPERLDAIKIALSAKLSPATVQKIFSMLRAAVNFAVRRKKFSGLNPFSRQGNFTMPKVDNRGERYLKPEEAAQLMNELEKRSTQLFHMAIVSLHTGMRSSELFNIRGADIDELNRIANIRAKGGARETVFLEPNILEILKAYRTTPDALIFQGKEGQKISGISDTFNRSVDALGLNDDITDPRYKVWFHTLRHTFASWLAQSGKVTLIELQRLMRHKRIEMTLRYAHLIPDQQRGKLSIIEQVMTAHRQESALEENP